MRKSEYSALLQALVTAELDETVELIDDARFSVLFKASQPQAQVARFARSPLDRANDDVAWEDLGIIITSDPISLVTDGYENGVNCSNRVGRDDTIVAGWYDDESLVTIKDNDWYDSEGGIESRHGGNTGSSHFDSEKQLTLSDGEWALVWRGRISGHSSEGEYVLYVG